MGAVIKSADITKKNHIVTGRGKTANFHLPGECFSQRGEEKGRPAAVSMLSLHFILLAIAIRPSGHCILLLLLVFGPSWMTIT